MNEAIAKATALRPDLIIMDYKMHHSDGLVAADGIFKALPNVPIVMFTLHKTDELEHAANPMGIRCVVGKEEGFPSLLSAIEPEFRSWRRFQRYSLIDFWFKLRVQDSTSAKLE